jgi:putative colanic acid biosynthesis acetyltransferase WcaF
MQRNLAQFSGTGYDKGRGRAMQIAWLLVSGLILRRWWCPMSVRIALLRRFGADVASSALIRHGVKIHWPWKLKVGEHSWIGEETWILNLERVEIGANVCVSQDVLLCTGSHDRHSATFEFDNAPIRIADGAWIAARATVLRGVNIGEGAVVGATALVTKDVPAGDIVWAPAGVRASERDLSGR